MISGTDTSRRRACIVTICKYHTFLVLILNLFSIFSSLTEEEDNVSRPPNVGWSDWSETVIPVYETQGIEFKKICPNVKCNISCFLYSSNNSMPLGSFTLSGSPQHIKFYSSRSAKLDDLVCSTGCCEEGAEFSVARKARPACNMYACTLIHFEVPKSVKMISGIFTRFGTTLHQLIGSWICSALLIFTNFLTTLFILALFISSCPDFIRRVSVFTSPSSESLTH